MKGNPLAAGFAKKETALAAGIAKDLDKALEKSGAGASCSAPAKGKAPPKEVVKAFDKALAAALKKAKAAHPGMEIDARLSFSQDKSGGWIAKAAPEVRYCTEKRGGGSHRIARGETLWSIAADKYGQGVYWPVLADANPKAVKSGGDFILAGVSIRIPQIEVPATACKADSLPPGAIGGKAPKDAAKPAKPLCFPALEAPIKLDQFTKTTSNGAVIVITTAKLSGTIKAWKCAAVPISFNMKSLEAEVTNGANPFVSSISFKGNKVNSVEIGSNTGTLVSSSIKIDKFGRQTLKLKSRPVKWKVGDVHYEATTEFELTIDIIANRKVPITEPVPIAVHDAVYQHRSDLQNVAMFAVGSLVLIWAVGNNLTGVGIADDVVLYPAAARMMAPALRMIAH